MGMFWLASAMVGMSFALTTRTRAAEPLWRSPVLWTLCLSQFLLWVPLGGYLLTRHPDWHLMYLAHSNELSMPAWSLALTYPLVAITAFTVARIFFERDVLVWLGLGILALLAALLTVLGGRQLSVLGSTDDFLDGELLPRLWGSYFGMELLFTCIAFALLWGISFWRLRILGQTDRLSGLGESA